MDLADKTVKKKRGEKFVEFVVSRVQTDKALRAALRRADNPATENQAWEYLSKWCDLDNDWERKPLALIAAAIARAKPGKDGNLGVGKALAACYNKGNHDQAKAKLRRLLACNSIEEVCVILRPLLSLMSSRSARLCYGRLLDDLLYFGDGEKVKVRWAVDF